MRRPARRRFQPLRAIRPHPSAALRHSCQRHSRRRPAAGFGGAARGFGRARVGGFRSAEKGWAVTAVQVAGVGIGLLLLVLLIVLAVAVSRLRATVQGLRHDVEQLLGSAAPQNTANTPALVHSVPLPAAERSTTLTAPSLVVAVAGGPLVKLAAFLHALRRALDPPHRDHLRRVVRRELRARQRDRRAPGRPAPSAGTSAG